VALLLQLLGQTDFYVRYHVITLLRRLLATQAAAAGAPGGGSGGTHAASGANAPSGGGGVGSAGAGGAGGAAGASVLQAAVLAAPGGVARLVDCLDDARELIRNGNASHVVRTGATGTC
jgi:hypothetical protein